MKNLAGMIAFTMLACAALSPVTLAARGAETRPAGRTNIDAAALQNGVYGRYQWSAYNARGQRTALKIWAFWRTDSRIEIASGDAREIWQWHGSLVSLRQIDHHVGAYLETHQSDTSAFDAKARWALAHQFVDPDLLRQLSAMGSTQTPYGRAQKLSATIVNQRVALTMLDLGIPLRWSRSSDLGKEKLELLELTPIGAVGAPQATKEAELSALIGVDFADIGDRENDPIVRQLVSRFHAGHAHHALH